MIVTVATLRQIYQLHVYYRKLQLHNTFWGIIIFAYEKNKYSDTEYWLQEFLRKQNLLLDKFFNEI